MLTLLVNVLGVAVIVFIVMWFWRMKPKPVKAMQRDSVDIVVADGVYTPGVVQSKVGAPMTFRFFRKDVSPCAEQVIFAALERSQSLPLNEWVELAITPPATGEYEFTCQMGMYRGRWLVNE